MPLTLQFGRLRWSASWSMTVLTLAGVVLFVGLGRWQWHRAAEAQALRQAFTQGGGTAIDLADHSVARLPRYREVQARGRYDSAHQFLLDNMSHADTPGYQVLTPLQLPDGRTLIVNRGWLPLTGSRERLPEVPVSVVPGTAIGRLDDLPRPGISLGHAPPPSGSAWPKLTSFPTMADLSAALGRPLEPRELLLDARAPFGYLRDWQPPGMTPAQHLSYAFQWWAFAAIALGLYGVLNRRRRPVASPLQEAAARKAGARVDGGRA